MIIQKDMVRRLRQERGWTQAHLAEAADVSPRTIQRIERDGAAAAETVLALCAALQCEPASLQAPALPEATKRVHPVTLLITSIITALIIGIAIGAYGAKLLG